jgi:inosine-uridine nucleoside N-ribohydrolase
MVKVKNIIAAVVVCCTVAANSYARAVIFDNDAAIDDTMALILLSSDKSTNLKAITIAGTGEAHGRTGAENMAAVAHLLNQSDVPVAYGRALPLSKAGHAFPEFKRAATDQLLKGKNVVPHSGQISSDNAVELIRQVAESSDGKVTILATGPLTNVADFVSQYPQLKNKIERIVVMGGAVKVPGNIKALLPDTDNTVSELNFYADPEAVHRVFSSGIPVTLVALDATNQVPITKQFYDAVMVEHQPDLQLAAALLNDAVKNVGMNDFMRNFYFWDQLAAMVMLDPAIAEIQSMPLVVDANNGRVRMAGKGERATGNINVVTKIIKPDSVLSKYLAMTKSSHTVAMHRFNLDAGRVADQNKINRIGSLRYA